jgi:type I restriction enzyme R subunit
MANFMELLKNDAFIHVTESSLRDLLHYLRKEGNDTAHGGEGDLKKAVAALGVAHQLGQYMAVNYYGFTHADLHVFVCPEQNAVTTGMSSKELEKILEENRAKQEQLSRELELERKARQHAEATADKLQAARARSQQTANSLAWDENQTRKMLIDTQLVAAGWDLSDPEQVGVEIEVLHQPTASGIGYADYVLWGDDGNPLAVIEAKRSRENMQKGREQARYYAEGLAKQFNCPTPIVFYTNGYEICIWDTKQYNAYRQVFGFYSKNSLMFLHYQHQHKDKNLETLIDWTLRIKCFKNPI